MTNEQLQRFLKDYPNECEIFILENDCKAPFRISAEYYADDEFSMPRLIIEV